MTERRESTVANARYVGRYRRNGAAFVDPETRAVFVFRRRAGFAYACYETDEAGLFDVYLEPRSDPLAPRQRHRLELN